MFGQNRTRPTRKNTNNESSVSTKALIEDKGIEFVLKAQEILAKLPHFEDINYKVSFEELKSLDVVSNEHSATFVRNVIIYSGLFPKKIPQYMRIIDDFHKMHDLTESIRLNISSCILYGLEDVIQSFIEKKYFDEEELAAKRKAFNVRNRIRSKGIKEISLKQIAYKIKIIENDDIKIKIIENDDIESLKQIAAQPDFNINDKLILPFNVHIHQPTLVQYAAYSSATTCLRYFLNNNANLDGIMRYAIAGGLEEIIQILEQSGIKPDQKDILHAIEFHRREIFDWLFEQFPDCLNDEAFEYCIKFEFPYCLSKFMNFYPQKPFIEACVSNFVECANAIVNNYDVYRMTGLLKAIEQGNTGIVQILHNLPGIDFNFKDSYSSKSYIIKAVESGEIEIVKMIGAHPETDMQEVCMETFPLLSACKFGYFDIVKLLVEQYGVDINQNSEVDDVIFLFSRAFN